MTAKRIFLIHATPVAIEPINQAFARLWPEAELSNLLEDSLSKDLAKTGDITPAMNERFLALTHYAVAAGADGILFTCSAFGESIDLCKKAVSIPVLKPNEAMIDEAIAKGSKIAIFATFEPAIKSMTEEFEAAAHAANKSITVSAHSCPAALEALHAGESAKHDEMIARLANENLDTDLICFAQFSMVSAAELTRQSTQFNVLTTPDSAVLKLRSSLGA